MTTIERAGERVTDAMNAHDGAAHRDCYAEGFVWRDHRSMVAGEFAADEIVDALGPIDHIDASTVLCGTDRVFVARCDIASSDFAMEFLNVMWCGPDSRYLAIDTFPIDDVDAAVDRYFELVDLDAGRFGADAVENRASRAHHRLNTNLNLRRFDPGVELLAPDVRGVDHRGGSVSSPRFDGSDAIRRNWEAMGDGVGVGLGRTIAVAGDNRALQVLRFDVASDFVVDVLAVVEVDDEGHICSFDSFDLDAHAAATAHLHRAATLANG